jgi:hypothetical protein
MRVPVAHDRIAGRLSPVACRGPTADGRGHPALRVSLFGVARASGEMADAHGSGPCVRKDVGVQLPPCPLWLRQTMKGPGRGDAHRGPSSWKARGRRSINDSAKSTTAFVLDSTTFVVSLDDRPSRAVAGRGDLAARRPGRARCGPPRAVTHRTVDAGAGCRWARRPTTSAMDATRTNRTLTLARYTLRSRVRGVRRCASS